ncbi:hypothetical protein J6590_096418 [Homalodisca vitripennis]|nr:hypothetical protein J6590_096418 [Homalodisca vitripennis]
MRLKPLSFLLHMRPPLPTYRPALLAVSTCRITHSLSCSVVVVSNVYAPLHRKHNHEQQISSTSQPSSSSEKVSSFEINVKPPIEKEQQIECNNGLQDCWNNSQKPNFAKGMTGCLLKMEFWDVGLSAGHQAADEILSEAKDGELEKNILKQRSQKKGVTEKIFRTAYKVVKENQSFNDFETEIDLQELNGINMGRILHSNKACANIALHIS